MPRTLMLLAFVLSMSLVPLAQNPPPPAPPPLPDASQSGTERRPPTPDEVRRQQRMEKERIKQRYVDLQRDSARLLTLATQLKQEVDAAGDETLSLEVIKKADEIEKLAKSVKRKMKGD